MSMFIPPSAFLLFYHGYGPLYNENPYVQSRLFLIAQIHHALGFALESLDGAGFTNCTLASVPEPYAAWHGYSAPETAARRSAPAACR